MNISDQPLDSRYLRIHPKHYADEPTMGNIEFTDPHYRENPVGEKIGGKGKRDKAHNERIAELIRENEELKKLLNIESENHYECHLYADSARAITSGKSIEQDIAELSGMATLLDTERKRSARWKKVAQKYYAISQAWIGD